MADHLALEWGRQELRGVAAVLGGGRPAIRRCFTLAWPEELDLTKDRADVVAWLKGQLRQLGISVKHASVTLRREDVVVRRLELPEAPDEDLPDLVRFQMAAKSALPVDQLAVDFIPLPSRDEGEGREALVASIPKSTSETICAILGEAGLDVTSLGIGATALAELTVRAAEHDTLDPAETCLVVVQQPGRCELLVLQDRRLVFSHAATPFRDNQIDAILTEVSRATVALEGQHGHIPIDRVWLLSDSTDTSLLEALEQRFRATARTLDPWELTESGPPDDVGPESQLVYAPLVGLLLAQSQPLVPTVDFLHPRERPVVKDFRKAKLLAAVAGIVVLLGGIYALRAYQLNALKLAVATRTKQLQKVKEDLKTLEPELKKTDAVAAWAERDMNCLDLTRELAATMNGTERYYITTLVFDQTSGRVAATVKANGVAKDRRDIETLYAQIMKGERFEVQPNEISKNSPDEEYPFRFELDADLKSVAKVPTGKRTGGPSDVRVSQQGQPSSGTSQRATVTP